VLRALDGIDDGPPEAPARRLHRRWLLPAALVAVTAPTALLLPHAIRDRGQGDTITGNAQNAPIDAPSTAELPRQAAERSDDPAAHIAYARALLSDGQLVDAIKAYDRAATIDPTNPEPLAYHGWIVLLACLPDDALPYLDRAVTADPSYPDAHFFRAMALRDLGRPADAVAELDNYLRLAPADDTMRRQVEALRGELARPGTTTTATIATTRRGGTTAAD
jgi:tetratricopeptide (TPR) repeat protein